ncbi:hypothetical protein MHM582_1280 [Microbacterium sp. HM58-2]|nr:hypothetical protein MHM582_1280 [Microbacterium sp. HM58-2]
MRSEYVSRIRSMIGHDLLLLPAVTAVIREGDRFLLARQRASALWGLIGGAIEPREQPEDAMFREVHEEIGVHPSVGRVIGVYGGDDLVVEYPNEDVVGYTTIAFECFIPSGAQPEFLDGELSEAAWFTLDEVAELDTHRGVPRMLRDAAGPAARVVEKSVCYLVHEDHLLVFTHDDADIMVTGVQVPAGTVRTGEDPAAAAARELREETGLCGGVVRALGSADYDLRPARDEIARRHFFLMRVEDADIHASWRAEELDPADGSGRIAWTCRWIPLAHAHVLAAGLGARIGDIPAGTT